MPESVQEQTISKHYGSPIPDSALPLDYDRRIVMDSTGCCSIAFFEKHSKEVLDYFVDAMKWLEPRELIIGASAWCEPETLVATRIEYASTGVIIWLAGGGDNERQTVNVQVSTSLGKIKLVQFVVQTIGVSSELTLVIVDDDAVTVGPNEYPEPNPDLEPILNAYPSSIKFPITAAVSVSRLRLSCLKMTVQTRRTSTVFRLHSHFFKQTTVPNAVLLVSSLS